MQPHRFLVAPDKFKGSLTAAEVADAVAQGLRGHGAEVETLPLADGGDGSVAAALAAGFSPVQLQVSGPLGEPVSTTMALGTDPSGRATAVLETAAICGLAMVPADRRDPLAASSAGLGQALAQVLRDHHPSRVVIALGGSATTDGGTGMLAALGARFLDEHGEELVPDGAALPRIARVDTSGLADLDGVELIGASDVLGALLGPSGAARMFSPQKGASPEQVELLEAGLANLAARWPAAGAAADSAAVPSGPGTRDEPAPEPGTTTSGSVAPGTQVSGTQEPGTATSGSLDQRDPAGVPGAGAAGGLGYGCLVLGGRLVPGAEFFLDLLGFDERAASADMIITGEGSLDEQTEQGKLISAVAAHSRVPVIAVAGRSTLAPSAATALGLAGVHAVAELTEQDTASDPELTRALLRRIGATLTTSAATLPPQEG